MGNSGNYRGDADDAIVKGINTVSGLDAKINSVDDNGKERLCVDAKVVVTSGDNAPCPSYTPKLRMELDKPGTPIALTAAYATVYNYSGSGVFISGIFDFNTNDVTVKWTIDSEVIFEANLSDIISVQVDAPGNSGHTHEPTLPFIDKNANKLLLAPKCPIRYSTNVKLEAKTTAGGNPQFIQSLTSLTKET